MEALRILTTVGKDGEIALSNLPIKEGQQVEIIVLVNQDAPTLTAEQLAESDIVGLWADRTDISSSADYARRLREQAQRRPK